MTYAEAEAKRLTTLVINKSISKQINSGYDVDSMFEIIRNSDGEIEMIDFNTVNVTRFLNSITNLIEDNLRAVSNGDISSVNMDFDGVSEIDYENMGKGIIFETTMGNFTGSSLISNIGPRIPIKMGIMGDVVSNVETDIREYGINNAYIEVGIRVSVDTMVNTPFISQVVNVEVIVPISMKVISGNIPGYYLNGFQSSSNLVGEY